MYGGHRSGASRTKAVLRYTRSVLPTLKPGLLVKMWFPVRTTRSHAYHGLLAELESQEDTCKVWTARVIDGPNADERRVLHYSEFVLVHPLELLAECADE